MKHFIGKFKGNLSDIPKRVRATNKGSFFLLLVTLFLLPGGSILSLFAIYFKLTNYTKSE